MLPEGFPFHQLNNRPAYSDFVVCFCITAILWVSDVYATKWHCFKLCIYKRYIRPRNNKEKTIYNCKSLSSPCKHLITQAGFIITWIYLCIVRTKCIQCIQCKYNVYDLLNVCSWFLLLCMRNFLYVSFWFHLENSYHAYVSFFCICLHYHFQNCVV